MRKNLTIFLIMVIFGTKITYAQNIIANPKSVTIIAKKTIDTDLIIPIEVDFVNKTPLVQNASITLQIDNNKAPAVSQFNAIDIKNVKLINASQTVTLNAYETKKAPNVFYFFIDRSTSINYDKTVFLNLLDGANLLSTIKISIQNDDKLLSLDEYLEENVIPSNRINRLDNVTKVESNNNIMSVFGYKEISAADGTKKDIFLKRSVELKKGEVFTVIDKSWVGNSFHWKPLPISIMTVPFKVRPSITSKGKEFANSATSGITNIGFNLDLGKQQRERYFSSGKKSTHKLSLGFWAAPAVEELDSVYTNGANGLLGKAKGKMEKSKQLFISTGLTISYSYNDISFVFVPFGFDFATSRIGKTWIYNKQRWWGFGIAISPKFFTTILNE